MLTKKTAGVKYIMHLYTVHRKETLNNRLGPSTISIEIKLSITDHQKWT